MLSVMRQLKRNQRNEANNMAKEDSEKALDKIAGWLGGLSSDVVKAKKARKKELEEAARAAGVKPKKD